MSRVIAVVGSRNYPSPHKVISTLLVRRGGIAKIVTGGAAGPDTIAAEFAAGKGIPLTVHAADWATLGRSAGPVRNARIVADCDEVWAFWDGRSRGTLDTIRKAVAAGKMVVIYPP